MNEKLKSFNEYLKNKKIAIIGAGVSNIPLIEILKNKNYDITIFDKKELKDMEQNTKKLIEKNNIKTSLGENYLENLTNFDVIFRSPSFLPTNPYLKKEADRGALVTTEIEQVIKLSPSKIIGVTGSKGKTTTTTIIYEILKCLGYSCYLGGNIGTPLYSKLDDMKKEDIVVLELSSFQLMNMTVSPNIAVIINISPDHLDVHGSYEEYINAKRQIYLNQTENDIVVLNNDDEIVKKFAKDAKGKVRYFSKDYIKDTYILENDFITYNKEKIIDTRNLLLKGKHNYLNICTALNTIKDYINVSNEKLQEIIANIKPVPHRLEYIRTINGVKWYNDSASTSPDKALGGINAFKEKIVLIAGGYDKKISYEPIAMPIAEKVSKLILFGQTKNMIYDEIMKLPRELTENLEIYVMDTLEEVVDIANKISTKDEVVLFSPASASFDMFKNAYQRGDIFKDLVNKL